jgi:hypothetical protein
MYGGGRMEPISETLFQREAGSESIKIEFIVEDDGSVNRFLMHREGEKLSVERKDG